MDWLLHLPVRLEYDGGLGGITHNSTFYGRTVGGGGGAGASSTGNGSNGTYHFPGNWSGSFAGRGGWGGTQPANDNGGNANNPGGAGGGGGGPDGTSTSGSGASDRISITHVGLEIASTPCECNNDQTPNIDDGTFSSILIIKTDDNSILMAGLDFTLISSTGITDEFGQSLNGSSFVFCNGYSCPSGVAVGQYYLPVRIQHSGNFTASVDVDKDGTGDLDLNNNCGISYPSLPVFPSGLTNVLCLDGDTSFPPVANSVYNIDNTLDYLVLPDRFRQLGHVILPDDNTLGSNSVLFIDTLINVADNNPVFELHLIKQLNGCRVASYKEFNVYNPVSPALKHTLISCRTPRTDDTVYLSRMFDDGNTGGGKFYINNVELEDGKYGFEGDVCESVTYTIIDSCGTSHTDTKSFQVTHKPTPSFEFITGPDEPTSPTCSVSPVTVRFERTSTGPSPEFTASSDNATYTPVIDMSTSSVELPAPSVADGVVEYFLCLTETNTPDNTCPGIDPDPCSETICKSFLVFRDVTGCGVGWLFPSVCTDFDVDVCNIETTPEIELGTRYFTLRFPPTMTAKVNVDKKVIDCNRDSLSGYFNVSFYDIPFDIAGEGKVKLQDLPGISVVCKVLNFQIKIGSWKWRPLQLLYDEIGCDRTIAQWIAQFISKEVGGDGGGYLVMADTDGDGAFDHLIDKDHFPSPGNVDFKIPNRVKGEGNITIRAVGGFMNSPADVCGDLDIEQINLLDLMPIGIIPVVGAMIEAILTAIDADISFTQSIDSTVVVPVYDYSGPEFLNCNTSGYVFAQTLDCDIPVDWSIPAANEGCSNEVLNFKGVTENVDITNYAGTETISVLTDITEPGVYQVWGPVPGSILQPGVYNVIYRAVGCNGIPMDCNFYVTVTAGDPILECPNDILVSTAVDQCVATG